MSEHKWDICNLCGPMVRCGYCGNNCCSGGSGEGCPDKCASAYEMQDAGKIPKEEHMTIPESRQMPRLDEETERLIESVSKTGNRHGDADANICIGSVDECQWNKAEISRLRAIGEVR